MTQLQLRERVLQNMLLFLDNTEDVHQAAFHVADDIFSMLPQKEKGRFWKAFGKVAEVAVPIIINNKNKKDVT